VFRAGDDDDATDRAIGDRPSELWGESIRVIVRSWRLVDHPMLQGEKERKSGKCIALLDRRHNIITPLYNQKSIAGRKEHTDLQTSLCFSSCPWGTRSCPEEPSEPQQQT
jgi:hypothetical protein